METPDYTPPHVEVSRPSLGFPLGIALLLIIIFSLSGIFSCYYHWEKLRSFRLPSSDASVLEADSDHDTSAAKLPQMKSSLPVLMPGDQIPKFIALPCPREPPAGPVEKIHVVVKKTLPFPAMPFYQS